ncbi:MAG: alpha/beta fold hydrolase [Polyangia bacterium]|jgi:pimeloyl-ACP methyl ester carboxylesterase|nr:alpha/beta fold hydrolase [Polyangia bacterium]
MEASSAAMLPPMDTDRFMPIEPPGARLAYGAAGDSGSPVLLLMGFAMPGRAWRHQAPVLARHHRVAFLDNRGSGNTEAPPGAYSMGLLAADAIALMDHLGWEDAHVVGVSMGGMVAQHLALGHRRRLRSLTLIVTHPGGPRHLAASMWGLSGFLRVNLARTEEARLEALERLLFPASFLASCDRALVRENLRRDLDVMSTSRKRLSQLAAVLRHDVRARLGELAGLPTLVVKAEKDILVHPSSSDYLHGAIPGSRLLPIPGAGHGVIRQCHAELNQALLAHFSEVG